MCVIFSYPCHMYAFEREGLQGKCGCTLILSHESGENEEEKEMNRLERGRRRGEGG